MSQKPLLNLTEQLIRKCCNPKIFDRGVEYIDAVSTLILRGDEISVKVYGNRQYRVKISFNQKKWKYGVCNCPTELRPCKHIIAVLLKILHEGFDSIEPSLYDSLKLLGIEALRDLVLALVEKKPHLIDDIQTILSGESENEEDEWDDECEEDFEDEDDFESTW